MYLRDVSPAETSEPPAFLHVVGDPVRWRLLRELAHGDLRVRELVDAVGEPQSLVSYHLGRLRKAGLLTSRRSDVDGRDTYYHLDLDHYAQAWAEAGTALYPGLRFTSEQPPGPATHGARTPATQWRVLFLCTGNSGRSPMAEALLRHRAGGQVVVASAGSRPKPVHPSAVRALAEYGIALEHEPTHVDTLLRRRFHLVITLCDREREVCPEFPGRPETIHWSIPDPADRSGNGRQTQLAFRRTAAELDNRIRFLRTAIAGLTAAGRHR